jgi:hypothetical protein
LKPLFFLILSLLFWIAPAVLAVDTIQPAEASKRAGEEVYAGGFRCQRSCDAKAVAFIKLGEAYQRQVFTGFIQNLNAINEETPLISFIVNTNHSNETKFAGSKRGGPRLNSRASSDD